MCNARVRSKGCVFHGEVVKLERGPGALCWCIASDSAQGQGSQGQGSEGQGSQAQPHPITDGHPPGSLGPISMLYE